MQEEYKSIFISLNNKEIRDNIEQYGYLCGQLPICGWTDEALDRCYTGIVVTPNKDYYCTTDADKPDETTCFDFDTDLENFYIFLSYFNYYHHPYSEYNKHWCSYCGCEGGCNLCHCESLTDLYKKLHI